MTLRSFFLFIHIVSSMGVFGTLAIEGALLWRLRSAIGMAQIQDALAGFRLLRVLVPLSLAPTVMSGMYLVRTVWGWHAAWINVALASLVVAAVAGATATALSAHLRKTAAGRIDGVTRRDGGDGPDPILSVSFVMKVAIFIGIVFLMTVKPGLEESLIGMGAAVAVGVIASVTILRAAGFGNMHIERRRVARRGWSPEQSR